MDGRARADRTRHRNRLAGVVFAVLGLLATVPSCSSDDGPTRVLLIGDSTMNQLATGLERQVGPDVEIRDEAVFGSGLLSPWYFDWPPHLNQVLEDYDPDIVVFLFVGNYGHGTGRYHETADGQSITERTSPAFFRAWQGQAEHMTERAAEDAAVAWILPPPMRPAVWRVVVDGLRDVYEEVAEEADVDTIDSYDVLATPDGGFLARGRDPQGRPALLRSVDGVHLAPGGAAVLAVEVIRALDL